VRGLSGGIETFCKWAMPAMALCAIFVLVRVLTLDSHGEGRSVSDGLGYMWNPDFAKLKSAETWIAAAGQIFFSLSVGFGVIINYASYMRKKDDLVLSGLTSSATNEVFEVGFGGLITLTAAVVFLGVAGTTEAVSGGSFGLGFSTLPIVFAHMPWGNLFGFLWFFMLFLAAITSSISMYQPTMAFLEESLGVSRKQAAGMVVALGAIGSGWCVWHSGGLVALDTIDSWVGTLLIVVLALVQVVAFGWVWGLDAGMKEAHHGSAMRIPAVIRFVLKYVAPIYLLVALGLFVKDDLPKWVANLGENTVARNSVLLVAGVIAFLVACTAIGARRWRGAGLDLDGERLPDEDLQSNQRS
jgi:SNF family Na+-dependent transporter